MDQASNHTHKLTKFLPSKEYPFGKYEPTEFHPLRRVFFGSTQNLLYFTNVFYLISSERISCEIAFIVCQIALSYFYFIFIFLRHQCYVFSEQFRDI